MSLSGHLPILARKFTEGPGWRMAAMCLCLSLWGCSSEDDWSQGQDYGRLQIEVVPEIELKASVPGLKVPEIPVPAVDDYSLVLSEEVDNGKTAQWDCWGDFPQNQRYLTGHYTVRAWAGEEAEGEVALFEGCEDFIITSGKPTTVTVRPQLAQAVVGVNISQNVIDAYPGASIILHSSGGEYVPANSQIEYMNPEELQVIMSLPYNGDKVTFTALKIPQLLPSTFYQISIDYDASSKMLSTDAGVVRNEVKLDAQFLNAPAPEVITHGFESNVPLKLPEGTKPTDKLQFVVSSKAPLASIILNINAPQTQLPKSIDLLDLSPAQKDFYASKGLDLTQISINGGTVDVTDLISSLSYVNEQQSFSSFSLLAIGANGKLSQPAQLKIETQEVDIKIARVSQSVIGSSEGEIFLHTPSNFNAANLQIEIASDGNRVFTPTTINEITPLEDNLYAVKFQIPSSSANVTGRLIYCSELRGDFTIVRYQPTFGIEVDAFATRLLVKIIPDEASRRELLTTYSRIFLNGKEVSPYKRYPKDGVIEIIGLEPSTRYLVQASALVNPLQTELTPEIEAITESTPALPNGNFEEVKDAISWKNLPSGGLFSQNSVEIYNCLNHQSFALSAPVKGWCTVNAKTFCTKAKNPNTWYMQPSAYTTIDAASGAYGVEITSTGFDPTGENIKNYLQTQPPYLKYSLEIPNIKYRAAGKLFLGSYSFNATDMNETYNEGISWKARPLSLSGFYKYMPVASNQNDQGLAKVTVYGNDNGKEILIGSGETKLSLAIGYTAFSVEIGYQIFGIKATKLCVMFASSCLIGSIDYETAHIVTDNDPVTASSLGSKLLIDNVVLAY